MKKKRSKKTKLLPVRKEKRSVELEKFVEGIKTRSCSKSHMKAYIGNNFLQYR
jgi:hypothetical protein